MRPLAGADRIRALLSALGRETPELLQLHRYPAIDPGEFRRRAEEAFGGGEVGG